MTTNDQPQPRHATPRKRKPAMPTPIPEAAYRTARRADAITGRVRASFRALRLLDHADSELVTAAARVLATRYTDESAVADIIADCWFTCRAWAQEWTV